MGDIDWDKDDRVCFKCVGDPGLRQTIREEGQPAHCRRCGTRREVVTVDTLASHVDRVYRRDYAPADGVYDSGDDPEEIIAGLLNDDDTGLPAVLVDLLSQREARDVRNGSDAMYDGTSRYEFNPPPATGFELDWSWEAFQENVKYSRRFSDPSASEFLRDLFETARSAAPPESDHPCELTLETGAHIRRARMTTSWKKVADILNDPARELGPPPREFRAAGRLNAPGISTFYGAFHRDTCVAEVRPHVGAFVVHGEFEVTRPLKLFDLTAFLEPQDPGSPFDDDFLWRLSELEFLEVFHDAVTEPVHPGEEAIAYAPTQVIAEFLANELEYDGIVYRSAQVGGDELEWTIGALHDHCNVAIFNAGGIVEGGEDQGEALDPAAELITDFVVEPDLPSPAVEKRGQPALRFVAGTETVVQVKRVQVEYELVTG